GVREIGLVLDDQHAHAPMLDRVRIAGVSKIADVGATRRFLESRHGLARAGTNAVRPDPDSQALRRELADPPRDRSRPGLSVALFFGGREPGGPRGAAQHRLARPRPGRDPD